MFFWSEAMPKQAVFTMKLESELRDAFIAEAETAHRPASQIVRELMRDFVARQRDERDYDAFLRRKVEVARGSVQAGRGRSDEIVEAAFAKRRADLQQKAGKGDA
jgi:predicted transcriptional regulator